MLPNWCQVWVTYPSDVQPLAFPSTMLWFNSTANFQPLLWDWTQFGNDFWSWFFSGVGGELCHPLGYRLDGSVYTGWNWSAPLPILFPPSPLTNVEDSLPMTQNVGIRRITNIRGRQGTSFIRIPMVGKSDADGSYLTPAALASWQAAAHFLMVPFVSQGVLFRPAIRYYSITVNRAPIAIVASGRLYSLRHRRRYSRIIHPFFYGPHPY